MQVQSLGWEDPLEKEIATHSSILAWRVHPKDRGAWRATVHRVAKSWTQLKQLSVHYFVNVLEVLKLMFPSLSPLTPLTYFLHFVPSWSWMKARNWREKMKINKERKSATNCIITSGLWSTILVKNPKYWMFRISFSFILCYRKIIKTDMSAFPNSFIIIRMKSNNFWQKINIRT